MGLLLGDGAPSWTLTRTRRPPNGKQGVSPRPPDLNSVLLRRKNECGVVGDPRGSSLEWAFGGRGIYSTKHTVTTDCPSVTCSPLGLWRPGRTFSHILSSTWHLAVPTSQLATVDLLLRTSVPTPYSPLGKSIGGTLNWHGSKRSGGSLDEGWRTFVYTRNK